MPLFTLTVLSRHGALPHLSPIQHIQNQAIRIITFSSYRSSASSLLLSFDMLSISSLFKYRLASILFKSLVHLIPSSVFRTVDLNTNPTRSASDGNFLLPVIRTNYGRHTAYFAALSIWSTLSTCLTVHNLVLLEKNRFPAYWIIRFTFISLE